MHQQFTEHLKHELEQIREAGLFKSERVIASTQGPEIALADGRRVLNFCANNYLGLAGQPWVAEAAKTTLDERGYGLASVRFICGTQDIHRELEQKIARFLGKEDAILYAACWDANTAIFARLFTAEDAIITDALNHASLIDGIRLAKSQRFIYQNCDMADLEAKLKEASGARFRIVVTDGVFSMEGSVAPLPEICALAEKYDAMVLVDDSHATGFVGKTGRGTPEHYGVEERCQFMTGTLGKALGGASGGYIAASKEAIEMLRQGARPYLFSNTLAPAVVGASIAVIDRLSETTELRDKLEDNTRYFREGMTKAGFDIKEGWHPIVPIMLYDAKLAQQMADKLLDEGIYVIGFSYPVVPKGEARIRVQISAAHEREHLDRAIAAFTEVGRAMGALQD